MELKITTLIENNPDDKGALFFEHGLSLYIEMNGINILFDTGQSDKFIENAKSLNKNLNELDYCILSHGHYDHTGGLEKLSQEISDFPLLLVGEEFFKPKYKVLESKDYVFNGNSFDEEFLSKKQINIKKVNEGITYLAENILVFHHFFQITDYEKRNSRFFIKEKDEYVPDDFRDEIALGIITEKGLVIVVGCSHVGIVNILKTISERVNLPIYAVIGGTHLVEADETRIQKTIDAFKEMNIQLIAVSHCTGDKGIQQISREMKQEFLYNNTGSIIEI